MKKALALVLALLMMLSVASFASAEEPISINLWSVFTGDDGQILQALVDEFNAEYEGQIVITHSPQGDPYTPLSLAVQTGTDVPDLLLGHVERVPQMVADGILTYMDSLTDGDVDFANYPEHVLARTNVDGYQYGIPWDFNAPILYCNLDVIAKYGLESLLDDNYITFDELNTAGEAVAAAGDTDTVKIFNFYGGFNQFVQRYEELGQVELIQDGNLVIDTQIWGDMLTYFRDLQTKGYVVDRDAETRPMFMNGELMFYEAGTWTNATLMQVEGLNYTAVPVVCFNPETALARCGSHTWMMPEDEERTEEEEMAAATVINWMGAHSLTWATQAGQVPLYKSVTEMDEFKACVQTFLADAGQSEHIKIFQYYYWNLFTSAVGQVGIDCLYDESIDLYTIGETIQKTVDDAIAAS